MRRLLFLLWLTLAASTTQAQHRVARPARAAAPVQSRAARNAQLDQYAGQVPAAYEGSVATLAGYLGRAAKSDYDKARLIYAWLGQHIGYDVESLQLLEAGQPVGDEAVLPAAVLRRRLAVCSGYADLFKALADTLHLRAEVVTGYAKPAPPPPGGYRFTETNHAWNAFFAEGRWHLLDATWAAGSINDEGQPAAFTAQYTSSWFDMAPATFAFSHLPEAARWQLLPQPLTMTRYLALPYLAASDLYKYSHLPSLLRLMLAAPETRRFPQLYSCAVPVEFQQLPLTDTLTAGQPYRFALDLPPGYTIVAFNNSPDLYDAGRELPLAQRGQHFSAVVTPTVGTLVLIVRANADDSDWTYPVEYKVRPATARPGSISTSSRLK